MVKHYQLTRSHFILEKGRKNRAEQTAKRPDNPKYV